MKMMNPNWSNERYEEHPEKEMKRKAFESKEGYSNKNYSKKERDQMNGMPIPRHMKKDCP